MMDIVLGLVVGIITALGLFSVVIVLVALVLWLLLTVSSFIGMPMSTPFAMVIVSLVIIAGLYVSANSD